MALQNLLKNDFDQAYTELEPDSIQHSYEIIRDSWENEEICHQAFLAADCAVYAVEKARLPGARTSKLGGYLYLGKRNTNILFKKGIEMVLHEVNCKSHYWSEVDEGILALLADKDTLKIPLSELKSNPWIKKEGYIEISEGTCLNSYKTLLARRLCGNDFEERIKGTIKKLTIWVLNQNYVLQKAKGGVLVLPVFIYDASGTHISLAEGDFRNDLCALRGERRK